MSIAAKERFLNEFSAALADDGAAIFVGAGVSMGAGYPSWAALLGEIGEELGVKTKDVHDLAALAQWSVESTGSYSRIRTVIRDNIALNKPVPESLKVICRLPSRHVWTTNYDRLIERAFEEISRPYDVVATSDDLAIRGRPSAAKIYKMHGSIERLDDLVISTDDYELYRSKRGAYLPLLEAHLSSMSVLFVGLSFADPNVRHVLSLIRESFTDAPPVHYAIVRPPQRKDFKKKAEYEARLTQHTLWARDLRRYGLVAIEVDDFDDVPDLLREVETRISRGRVWISGSWPIDDDGPFGARLYRISETLGKSIGELGLTLVSGAGLVVGSASIGGFIEALRSGGQWGLESRLIARPFPQPLHGQIPNQDQWSELRKELARLSGIVIFVGGQKTEDGQTKIADGVMKEFEIAKADGAFLLPIGATGGAAELIAKRLIGSEELSARGNSAMRPSDKDLKALCDVGLSDGEIVEIATRILKRVARVQNV